jgi:hypothetical protein
MKRSCCFLYTTLTQVITKYFEEDLQNITKNILNSQEWGHLTNDIFLEGYKDTILFLSDTEQE